MVQLLSICWFLYGTCLLDFCTSSSHILNEFLFLLAELGTSGSLNGQQRLVVKGRFAPKNSEKILLRYISKYRILLAILKFTRKHF
ncbi:unnamed protein product [Brassica napus]|uniref:(rape) hypothetical protein n=1 Tax=Brassica napus TaxID=3708 RepID=A0A816IKQ8_BRANA|nr:unnamed protein product [Brassica napus]